MASRVPRNLGGKYGRISRQTLGRQAEKASNQRWEKLDTAYREREREWRTYEARRRAAGEGQGYVNADAWWAEHKGDFDPGNPYDEYLKNRAEHPDAERDRLLNDAQTQMDRIFGDLSTRAEGREGRSSHADRTRMREGMEIASDDTLRRMAKANADQWAHFAALGRPAWFLPRLELIESSET